MQGGNAQNKKRFIIVSLILILSLAFSCFATVTESPGDGYSLFNGVKLPSLPEWDKETYPYAYIGVYGKRYAFVVSSSPVYVVSDDYGNSVFFKYGGIRQQGVSTNISNLTEWSLGAEISYSADDVFTFLPIWSNYNVFYGDGTMFLAASDPIPLDGMKVIEWDGDTSGLVTDGVGGYQVSSYFAEPGSAYAVWSESGFLSVSDQVSSLSGQPGSWFTPFNRVFAFPEGNSACAPAGVFFSTSNNGYVQTFAYRESETEGPIGAVTGLTITYPPVGEFDFITYAGSDR